MNSENIKQWLQTHKPGLTLIAASGVPLAGLDDLELTDFAPYVAAINRAGTVAFQAAWRCNDQTGTGIFCGNGDELTHLADHDGQWQFVSHPALNDDGVVSVYAEGAASQRVLLLWRGQGWRVIAAPDARFAAIGPLGPTMNAHGVVAFRADDVHGHAGVYVGDEKSCHQLAVCDDRFAAFQGLPVINQSGQVLFRADLQDGAHGIYCADAKNSTVTLVQDNRGELAELGLFPMLNDAGDMIFAATRSNGVAEICCIDGATGTRHTLLDSTGGLQDLRGTVINKLGPVAFIATPVGGGMSIYRFARSAHQAHSCVLAVGEALGDSQVAGLAINPVSGNERGQLSIRVALKDGQQLILRSEAPV
jgi:hypothetical protein